MNAYDGAAAMMVKARPRAAVDDPVCVVGGAVAAQVGSVDVGVEDVDTCAVGPQAATVSANPAHATASVSNAVWRSRFRSDCRRSIRRRTRP